MMGMTALELGGSPFGGRSSAGLALKIGREHAGDLIAQGRWNPFDPSGRGRAMKDWVVLGAPAGDWRALALEAKERRALCAAEARAKGRMRAAAAARKRGRAR